MKNVLITVACCLLLSACEKNIDLNLHASSEVLVVDAHIENGVAPVVILTKSLNYFSNLSPDALTNIFIHGAMVSITDGITNWPLKEYSYPTAAGVLVYTYTIDSAFLSASSLGRLNTSYRLHIQYQQKIYTAATTIPGLAQTIDSIFYKPATGGLKSDVVVFAKTTDTRGLGNYTRYFTQKNKGLFLPAESSVANDQVIDGTSFQLEVKPGIDRNAVPPYQTYSFRKGEVVTYKLCNIDKGSYDFWNTWEFAYNSTGNPFAQPNRVLGNISNGALGAFYGYAAVYKTIKVQL